MHSDVGPGRMSVPGATRPPVRSGRHAKRLREALRDLARGKATILSHREKSWASVTFAGARHRLELVFEGGEAVEVGEMFIAFLPEHQFDIPGQLVADAAVTAVAHELQPARMQVSCELLLLDEA